MTGDVRADPLELARLATDVLAAADRLADGLGGALDGSGTPPGAFGNSSEAPSVFAAQQRLAEIAGAAAGHLVEVLEGDVDRLYAVAFAYRKADRDAAGELCRTTGAGGAPPC